MSARYAGILSRRPVRNRFISFLFWFGFAFWSVTACIGVFARHWDSAILSAMFTVLAMHILLKCQLGLAAVRSLNEEMNSGALELLLGTPLSRQAIQQALKSVYSRGFRERCGILSLMNFSTWWLFALFPKHFQVNHTDLLAFGVMFLGGIVVLWVDFTGLFWLGMLNALHHRRMLRGFWMTVFPILILPWLVLFFLILIIYNVHAGDQGIIKTFSGWQAACVALDLFLIKRAGVKLTRHFREWAALRGGG